jgi:hypothetical protein
VDEVFFLEKRLQAELVLGAVIRLEERIRMEEDGGARYSGGGHLDRSLRWTARMTGRLPPWELGDGHTLWIPRTIESR